MLQRDHSSRRAWTDLDPDRCPSLVKPSSLREQEALEIVLVVLHGPHADLDEDAQHVLQHGPVDLLAVPLLLHERQNSVLGFALQRHVDLICKQPPLQTGFALITGEKTSEEQLKGPDLEPSISLQFQSDELLVPHFQPAFVETYLHDNSVCS